MTIVKDKLTEAIDIITNLCKSYECYTYSNKPKEEWDEYDYFMGERWERALLFLKEMGELE